MPAEDDRMGFHRSGLMRHHRPRQTARWNSHFFGAAARLLMQELSTTVLFEEHERITQANVHEETLAIAMSTMPCASSRMRFKCSCPVKLSA